MKTTVDVSAIKDLLNKQIKKGGDVDLTILLDLLKKRKREEEKPNQDFGMNFNFSPSFGR